MSLGSTAAFSYKDQENARCMVQEGLRRNPAGVFIIMPLLCIRNVNQYLQCFVHSPLRKVKLRYAFPRNIGVALTKCIFASLSIIHASTIHIPNKL